MINNKRLTEQLIKDEALRLRPYECSAGKLTIGVGRNLEDKGITEEEATHLLQNDLAQCWDELVSNFSWFERLNTYRQEVLINMCFNLGISRLKTFRKALNAMEHEDWKEAALQMMDSRWAKQVNSRAVRLSKIMELGYE